MLTLLSPPFRPSSSCLPRIKCESFTAGKLDKSCRMLSYCRMICERREIDVEILERLREKSETSLHFSLTSSSGVRPAEEA